MPCKAAAPIGRIVRGEKTDAATVINQPNGVLAKFGVVGAILTKIVCWAQFSKDRPGDRKV